MFLQRNTSACAGTTLVNIWTALGVTQGRENASRDGTLGAICNGGTLDYLKKY